MLTNPLFQFDITRSRGAALNSPRRYAFAKHCDMHRVAKFRVNAHECATTDMAAADMPIHDEKLRMAGT